MGIVLWRLKTSQLRHTTDHLRQKIPTVLQARDRVELSSQVHSLQGGQHRVGYHFMNDKTDCNNIIYLFDKSLIMRNFISYPIEILSSRVG